MGKISDYANVLKSKLTDLFVVYQRNDGELETKNATLEQLGDAICGEQVHATLETNDQTIIDSINELAKDKNIADEYDDTQTYDKGDVVIYKNTLYICNTNNTTGTWDATNWTATTIDNVIGSLSTLTTTDKSSIVGAVNELNRIDTKSITISITYRGYIHCYQVGRLVFVDININTDSNSTPVGTTIATGFPKPNESFYPRLSARDSNGSYIQVLNIDKNNGVIKTSDTVMQGNTWWGAQFTYFTND